MFSDEAMQARKLIGRFSKVKVRRVATVGKVETVIPRDNAWATAPDVPERGQHDISLVLGMRCIEAV